MGHAVDREGAERPRATLPSRPVLAWLALSVVIFAFLMTSALVTVWRYGWHGHAPVGLVVLACAGAAALSPAPLFALIRFFPRAAVATGADVFRPVALPPSRLIGPSIGWPAFLVGLSGLAVIGWCTWTGWMVSDRTEPGLAFAVCLVCLLRAARPWGHGRDRVPSRFPFGAAARRGRRS